MPRTRPSDVQKKRAHELVKQARLITVEDFQTRTCITFCNCYGHEYSFCNSVFLYLQGAHLTYEYPEDIVQVVMAGKNQWEDCGRQIRKYEEAFFIWVPSMKRKKAQHDNSDIKEEELKKHHFYLCSVWTEAQTEVLDEDEG